VPAPAALTSAIFPLKASGFCILKYYGAGPVNYEHRAFWWERCARKRSLMSVRSRSIPGVDRIGQLRP
jgi:hypothetical protein